MFPGMLLIFKFPTLRKLTSFHIRGEKMSKFTVFTYFSILGLPEVCLKCNPLKISFLSSLTAHPWKPWCLEDDPFLLGFGLFFSG